MIILSIETSCDETAAAVVENDRVLSNVVWSQIKYHRTWGGVVPSIARRAHEERLPLVVSAALRQANLANLANKPHLSAIAVTVGPGLAPALEVGVAFAKKLAIEKNVPLIPVSHLEGHIASLFLRRKTNRSYLTNSTNMPNLTNWISLIVSGGHTELVATHARYNHVLLGQTLDDAAGECIDKVGRELGLGYPAGVAMEQLAHFASPQAASRDLAKRFQFPIPLLKSSRADLNFSFSGLKTAAIQMLQHSYAIKKARERTQVQLSKQETIYFCASFQEAVIDALLLKLKRAVEITGIKTVFLSGGVAANNRLRRRAGIVVRSLGGEFFATPKQYSGDNAAMIGLAAQWAVARGEIAKTREEIEHIDRLPNLNFSSAGPLEVL